MNDKIMNDKIKKIKSEIEKYNEKIYQLKEDLQKEKEIHLKSYGIVKGTKVIVRGKVGIFTGFKNGKPLFMKIKKDGTPHKTATLYYFNEKDIDFDSVKELNK